MSWERKVYLLVPLFVYYFWTAFDALDLIYYIDILIVYILANNNDNDTYEG